MFDDAPLTWVDAPPPPAIGAATTALVDRARAALDQHRAVTLVGTDGSGRRSAALAAVGAVGRDRRYLVPGVPWRAPEALREIARQLGTVTPGRLPPRTLAQLAAVAMAEADPPGAVIVDARIQADPGLLAAIRPPATWTAILIAPRGVGADTAWGPILDAGDPPPLAPVPTELASVAAAAAFFDPWEGAPRALVAGVAGVGDAQAAAAVDQLLATGRLRPARDPRRVLPTLHDFQARPELSDLPTRAIAERFVAAIASWCGRTGSRGEALLADDRANIMTALALWPEVAGRGLVAGFAHALPALVEDAACLEMVKQICDLEAYGDHETAALVASARRLLAPA